ncbi:hypothetical protein LCGC14_0157650 [marine sediment metagenome]|uniref:Uncharacterized protein n=1 Tax=marine sediment metagenome TaxID=412755 RepID=A0A0F9VC77_9ZZZZ
MKALIIGIALMAALAALTIGVFSLAEQSSAVESPSVHLDSER